MEYCRLLPIPDQPPPEPVFIQCRWRLTGTGWEHSRFWRDVLLLSFSAIIMLTVGLSRIWSWFLKPAPQWEDMQPVQFTVRLCLGTTAQAAWVPVHSETAVSWFSKQFGFTSSHPLRNRKQCQIIMQQYQILDTKGSYQEIMYILCSFSRYQFVKEQTLPNFSFSSFIIEAVGITRAIRYFHLALLFTL